MPYIKPEDKPSFLTNNHAPSIQKPTTKEVFDLQKKINKPEARRKIAEGLGTTDIFDPRVDVEVAKLKDKIKKADLDGNHLVEPEELENIYDPNRRGYDKMWEEKHRIQEELKGGIDAGEAKAARARKNIGTFLKGFLFGEKK